MAMHIQPIDEYRIYHYSSDNKYGQSAIIQCYLQNSYAGSIVFYRDGVSIPQSTINSSKIVNLRFEARFLSEIITTIRVETPIFIGFNSSNNLGWVGTSREPVGEEES